MTGSFPVDTIIPCRMMGTGGKRGVDHIAACDPEHFHLLAYCLLFPLGFLYSGQHIGSENMCNHLHFLI